MLPTLPTPRAVASSLSLATGIVLALGVASTALAEKPRGIGKGGKQAGVMALAQTRCPPGPAKKDPACAPPGKARQTAVGSVIDPGSTHLVSRPGLYGLGEPPRGQRYAIVNGRLVRIDRESGRILSIIRIVDAILD